MRLEYADQAAANSPSATDPAAASATAAPHAGDRRSANSEARRRKTCRHGRRAATIRTRTVASGSAWPRMKDDAAPAGARDMVLRGYMVDFIHLFAPQYSPRLIRDAARAQSQEEVDDLVKEIALPLKAGCEQDAGK